MKDKIKKALQKCIEADWVTLHKHTDLDSVASLMATMIENEEEKVSEK